MLLILERITYDFMQLTGYLLSATVLTLCIISVAWIAKRKLRVSEILLCIYFFVMLQTTFLSREPGSRVGVDLDLFATWGVTAVSRAFFIENIIMFIPFGILMPMASVKLRSLRWCVFSGLLCSCAIELSQLLTQRGFCQLDDVVTNTVGAFLGWAIWNCTGKKLSVFQHLYS